MVGFHCARRYGVKPYVRCQVPGIWRQRSKYVQRRGSRVTRKYGRQRFQRRRCVYKRRVCGKNIKQRKSRRSRTLKVISCTIKDGEGKARYEFVSTAGIPKKQIASLMFCSYYMISHIPRAVFDLQDQRRYWRRIGDMVRLTGVHAKLQMILKPMSGFRVQMLMFQTPFHMKDMMGTSDLTGTGDNEASSPSEDASQGAFDGNAEIMSRLVIDDEGDYTCFLLDKYQKLFEKQIKNQEDLEFHDLVSRMRLTHPNTVGSKTVAMFEGFGLSAMQRLI